LTEPTRPHTDQLVELLIGVQKQHEPGATVRGIAQKAGRSTAAVYKALWRIRTWLFECMRYSWSERRKI
jgi:hypothetical protein